MFMKARMRATQMFTLEKAAQQGHAVISVALLTLHDRRTTNFRGQIKNTRQLRFSWRGIYLENRILGEKRRACLGPDFWNLAGKMLLKLR